MTILIFFFPCDILPSIFSFPIYSAPLKGLFKKLHFLNSSYSDFSATFFFSSKISELLLQKKASNETY